MAQIRRLSRRMTLGLTILATMLLLHASSVTSLDMGSTSSWRNRIRNPLGRTAQTTIAQQQEVPQQDQKSDKSSFDFDSYLIHQSLTTGTCFQPLASANKRTLLFVNNTAQDTINFLFRPADSMTISNYTFTSASTNAFVLVSESDTVIETAEADDGLYNVTVSFEFDRCAGITQYTLFASKPEDGETPSCSIQVEFLVAGFCIYSQNTEDDPKVVRTGKTGADPDVFSTLVNSVLQQPEYTFKAYFQYLDGSNSTLSVPAQPSIGGINPMFYDRTQLIDYSTVKCSMDGAKYDGAQADLDEECGVGFSVNSVDGQFPGVYFGVRFNQYINGRVMTMFEWSTFTDSDPEFQGEIYETFMEMEVSGPAPPVVFLIEPEGPFRSTGGEVTTLYFLNTVETDIISLRVDDQYDYAPGNFVLLDDGARVQNFTVSPGNGTNLNWVAMIQRENEAGLMQARDGTNPPYKYNYYSILSLVPNVGPETGGINVTLGAFSISNWDPNRDQVFFGGVEVPKKYIVYDSDGYYLTIVLPPRYVIGDPWVYEVSVRVDGSSTNLGPFTYLPDRINVDIDVLGGSYEGGDSYVIGSCNPSQYVGLITPAFALPTTEFKWTVTDITTGLLVPLDSDDSFVIAFGADGLVSGHNYTFELNATYFAKDAEGNEITREGYDMVKVYKSSVPGLGVDILPIVPRGINYPRNVLHVEAVITFPDVDNCFSMNDPTVTYEWTYGTRGFQRFNYFSENLQPNGHTPTKMGRQFVIEMDELELGNTTIKLVAYLENQREVRGQDQQVIRIVEYPLRALINGGLAQMDNVVVANTLEVSASESYDPNIVNQTEATEGLTYGWTCLAGPSISEVTEACSPRMFPSSNNTASFEVNSAGLRQQLGDESSIWVQYTLQVSKEGRLPDLTTLLIHLVSSQGNQPLAGLQVLITDALGNVVDLNKVPFYQDILISPIVKNQDYNVSYDILSPASETNIAKFASDLPGYWDPTDPNKGLRTLLVPAMSMSPDSTFVFELRLTSQGTQNPLISRVEFQTASQPELTLLAPANMVGDTGTVFLFQAVPSVENDANWQCFFYIENMDANALPAGPMCVNGCNGNCNARFQIPVLGNYSLKVELWDALNYAMIRSVTSEQLLQVVLATRPSADMTAKNMETLYLAGDHAQYGLSTLFWLGQICNSSAASNRATDRNDAVDLLSLSEIIYNMSRIAHKTIPNGLEAQDLMRMSALAMKLPASMIQHERGIYQLWSFPVELLSHAPTYQQLVMTEESEYLLNYSRKHMNMSEGSSSTSSRNRLVRQDASNNVNSLVLDYYELSMSVLTSVLGRGASCGSEFSASTIVDGGDSPQSDSDEHISMNVAVSCGHVSEIRADHSSLEWCSKAYDVLGDERQRSIFSLMESDDLVHVSNVQGSMETAGLRLVRGGYYAESSMTGFVEKVANSLSTIEKCYSFRIDLSPNAPAAVLPVLLLPVKEYGMDKPAVQWEMYKVTGGATNMLKDTTTAEHVYFDSNNVGVMQVREGVATEPTLSPSPESQLPPGGGLTGAAIAGVVVGIMVFILIAIAITWLIASRCLLVTATPPPPLEADETFVERDVYGRSMWAYEMGMEQPPPNSGPI